MLIAASSGIHREMHVSDGFSGPIEDISQMDAAGFGQPFDDSAFRKGKSGEDAILPERVEHKGHTPTVLAVE
ncbi:MAG TPA: hypothetical protein VJR03_08400 [Nitrospira sp.]|nr:hypothetical protein [Nitrospira sp.]